MEKKNQDYYPEPLSRAIGNYEKNDIPGLLNARQELSREVTIAFNSGNKEDQQKAIEGLLEAIESRMLTLSADLRSDLKALETDFSKLT